MQRSDHVQSSLEVSPFPAFPHGTSKRRQNSPFVHVSSYGLKRYMDKGMLQPDGRVVFYISLTPSSGKPSREDRTKGTSIASIVKILQIWVQHLWGSGKLL